MRRVLQIATLTVLVLLMAVTPAFAQAPAVEVSDQEVTNNTVTIDSVVSEDAGWIVIHEDSCDNFGDVLGQAAVESGENTNVAVTLDEDVEADMFTDSLCAMLHSDEDTVGTFDFPDGDPPVQDADGNIVMTTFSVEAAAAAQQETPTATVEADEATPTVEADDGTPTATVEADAATPTATGEPETLPETGAGGPSTGTIVLLVGLIMLAGVGLFALFRREAGRTV